MIRPLAALLILAGPAFAADPAPDSKWAGEIDPSDTGPRLSPPPVLVPFNPDLLAKVRAVLSGETEGDGEAAEKPEKGGDHDKTSH